MIRTVDLRVDYGAFTAVRGLNLEIRRGEIFGLIGPNGAGKTTTIRVLATLLAPTSGEAYVGGHEVSVSPREVRRLVGYQPDGAPISGRLRVWELLDLYASSHGIPPNLRRVAVDEALEAAQLTGKARELSGSLSRGLRQRLVLAKTLIHDPEVLLLDEPTSGLDPRARITLRRLLKELAVRGTTVIISSHILTELQGFCTSLGIMEEGRLVACGTLASIVSKLKAGRTLVVTVLGSEETLARAKELLRSAATVTRVEDREEGELVVGFAGSEADKAALLARLVRGHIPVTTFREELLGVEEVFLAVGAGDLT